MLDSLKIRASELQPGDIMRLPMLRIIERVEHSKRSCNIIFRNGSTETLYLREHVRVYREMTDD